MTKLVSAIVISGPLKGHKYIVKSDSKILIGRGDEANIRIGYDDYCSRKHALLYWEGNACFIEDLNSTNGTFINANRITGKVELHNGDLVGLGGTELAIKIEDAPKGEQSSSGDDITYED